MSLNVPFTNGFPFFISSSSLRKASSASAGLATVSAGPDTSISCRIWLSRRGNANQLLHCWSDITDIFSKHMPGVECPWCRPLSQSPRPENLKSTEYIQYYIFLISPSGPGVLDQSRLHLHLCLVHPGQVQLDSNTPTPTEKKLASELGLGSGLGGSCAIHNGIILL